MPFLLFPKEFRCFDLVCLIVPSTFVIFPKGITVIATSFVCEWETSTLQRLGKAQALRV